jgi:tubulin monoglycylase TTLL3/8
MKEIVNETLTVASETIEQRSNSFELYGFDFVLDKELRPWLIEINSNPACSNRIQ